jgi:hypothetical protein
MPDAVEVSAAPSTVQKGNRRSFDFAQDDNQVSRFKKEADDGMQGYSAGASILSSKKNTTPAKNTRAMRIPGSRFTSGTRSVAAT